MNRAAFFAALRARDSGVFGTSLSQAQVHGIETVLDVARGESLDVLAYALATAYHETGGRMVPITENLTYSSASRIKAVWPRRFPTQSDAAPYVRNPQALAEKVYGGRLGNKQPGDGWRYRGHGLVQITGRDNFRRFGRIVGADLEGNPALALDPVISAKALVWGIRDGLYTGKKAADFLPHDPRGARAIINADVAANGEKVAGYYRSFRAALDTAGWASATPPERPAEQPSAPVDQMSVKKESGEKSGLWAAILTFLSKWIKK